MDMNRWLVPGTALAAGLLVVALLPPRTCPSTRSEVEDASLAASLSCPLWYSPPRRHERQARTALNRIQTELRLRALADTILRPGGRLRRWSASGLTVVTDPMIPAERARQLLARAEQEYHRFGGTGPAAVPLVLAVVREPPVTGWGVSEGSRSPVFVTRGTDGRATCVSAFLFPDAGALQRRLGGLWNRDEVLGWCALYARFGDPGPHIERWLGVATTFSWLRWAPVRRVGVPVVERESPWDPASRTCLVTGRLCTLLVGTDVAEVRRYWGEWDAWQTRARLRAFIEDQAARSPAPFAALWRSALPVHQALAAAYGQPADSVIHHWARTRFEEPRRSGAPKRVLLASTLWVALALAAAAAAGKFRTAD
jgi:hypothetical protein